MSKVQVCYGYDLRLAVLIVSDFFCLGRRDNKWVSPYGCLLFSAHADIPKGTPLAGNMAFIQYLCSLAVVKGIQGISGYEVSDVKRSNLSCMVCICVHVCVRVCLCLCLSVYPPRVWGISGCGPFGGSIAKLSHLSRIPFESLSPLPGRPLDPF